MFKGLLTDAVLHLKECIQISISLLVTLAASFLIFRLSGKKAEGRFKASLIYVLCGIAVLLFPVSAAIFRMITGVYYDAPDMWMLIPVICFGAYALTLLLSEVNDRFTESRSAFYLGTAILVCALLVCGSLGTPREQLSGRAENASAAQEELVRFYLEKIMNGEEPGVVLAPDDCMALIHTLSADARTLYGRDMWDGRLTKNRYGTYPQLLCDIHDHMKLVMSGLREYAPDMCKAAFENGADIIFLPGWAETEELDGCGFSMTVFTASNGEEFLMITRGTV